MTRILALDPSLKCIGWCVYNLDTEKVMNYGSYSSVGASLDMKLKDIHRYLEDGLPLSALFQVRVGAIEMPVYHKNARTLRDLAQLCGVIRLSLWGWTERTIEVLPQERLAACGLPVRMRRDNAKRAVLQHVNARFGLDLKPEDNDIADAIAVALAAAIKLREEEWANA